METRRSSRMLEHVVLQEPPLNLSSSSITSSPAPLVPRLANVAVSIELDDEYGDTPNGNKKSDRRKLRRKPNKWSIKFYQRYLRRAMRSKEWTIFMIIVILYVLFVDDIVAMTKAYKNHGLFEGVGISKMVVLAIFILEFCIQLFAMRREHNYKSLFFWLDLIAIGSLIPDVLLLAYGANSSSSVSVLAIARAGRAARASGRVARILRVSQFYSCFGYNSKEEEEKRRMSDPQNYLEPSRMGNRLINRTTNKVVVIVLVLLFVSSFLQSELDATPFVRAGLTELEALSDMGTGGAAALAAATQRYISSQRHLIFLSVRGTVLEQNQHAMDNIFATSLLKFKTVKAVDTVQSEAWFDNRDEMATQGGYNLGLLLLVIVLLTLGNLLIIRDTTRMVIIPMERVLAVLKQLSPNKSASNRVGRTTSGNGRGGEGGATARARDTRRSRDLTDTSDDMTSNSGIDDDEDEAEALFGMLNDIDGNLQAAKERADHEATENQRLRNRIMDLIAEKKLVEIQVSGIKRRAKLKAETEGCVNLLDDVVEAAMQASRGMMRIATTAQKVNFGLAIGGRKFMSLMETDANDIRFTHHTPPATPTSSAHPSPPPSPTTSRARTASTTPDLEISASGSVTLAGVAAPAPARLELPQVQAATLDRLIERLTYEEYTDAKFIHCFLLTYRAIMSPIDLMERLFIRFCYVTPSILLPNDIPLEAVDEWRKQKQEPVRLGVCNALKLWIGRYFWDFENNEELVNMLRDFITHLLPETMMDRHAANIDSLFNKKIEEEELETKTPYLPPEPLTLEAMETLCTGDSDFSRFELVDLARQITLVEHDLYRAIKPRELLGQAWTKKHKERDSPNILRLIDHFNNISAWIKTQVVKLPKAKDRAIAIRKAVSLSEEFLKLGNFNGAMEVLAALSNASVSRMKKTWALLPTATTESFQDLGQLMSSQSSFKLYRERLHTSTPPSIPYIGVYLSDLVFIDEGNPDTVESQITAPLYNFDKNRQVAAVIHEIQKYQHVTYHARDDTTDGDEDGIAPNEEIVAFIAGMRGTDDDTAYKTSLVSEPRARAGSALSLSPSPSFLDRLRNSTPGGTL